MTSLKVGDLVIAARGAEGSDVLTGVEHHATILSFTRADRYGRRHVTVEYQKHVAGFPDIDTIKMKSGKGGNATVLPAPPAEAESPLMSSQSSTSSESTPLVSSQNSTMSEPPTLSESEAAELLVTQTYCAPDEDVHDPVQGSEPGCKWTPEWEHKVPIPFGEVNALHLLRLKVPDHILARWQQVSKNFVVKDLFGPNAAANVTLRGVKLTGLKDLVGATEYSSVPVKTGQNKAPHFGLTELFVEQSIGGRTTRARPKGHMYFYLMCRHPEQVQWTEFVPNTAVSSKRRRTTPFSLAEIGRLVAIIVDSKNAALVTMLLKKWDRAEVDASAGKKGVGYYWDQLAKLYNDQSYVPTECAAFQDHVASCDTEATYSTKMLPEYRHGNNLRTKWTLLRSSYALFHSKYTRSGHNEPDPTRYTSDLPVLLMHYTFTDTPFEAWAAKSMLHGSVDDAGDGLGGAKVLPKKKKQKRVSFTADQVIAAATVYETLTTLNAGSMTEEEMEEHKVRIRRAAKLMDTFLDRLENL